jgi:nucleoside-diphosphate-sugar epimerase
MNVLITGGGGFVGSHLVENQLRQGYRVRTVDMHVEQLAHVADHSRLEIVVGDITDVDLLTRLVQGIDHIYHLASAHLQTSVPDTRYWEVNVEGTKRLLRAAHAAGVKRVVHCSSVGVFGEINNPPADETAPCHPTNIYEQTKLAGEQAALEFSRQSGLPVVVVRPAWVYGPRCPRTHKLFRTIKKGRFVVVGDGQALRHPIYISDAVKGLELSAQMDNAIGGVYIIAGSTPVTVEALAQMISDVLGVPAPHRRIPVVPAKAVAYALQFAFKPLKREPPFSRRSVDFFLKDNAYDISKAERELGFHPQVDLREGLTKTWRWLSQNQGQAV